MITNPIRIYTQNKAMFKIFINHNQQGLFINQMESTKNEQLI